MLLVTPFAVLSASLHPDLSQAKAVRLPLRARTKQARRRPELKTLFVAASAARGERFYSACAGCHTPGRNQPHGVGPNLWGVVLRRVAAVPSYAYSSALRSLNTSKWGLEALNKFLKRPNEYAPGTYMTFSGVSSPAERMDVLRYLGLLSDAPLNVARFRFRR